MRIELQKLHREIDATMIYVTHDQTEAMTLGNRIAVLNKGNLMQLDTPLHLYNNPENKFVAGFIGSPTMNFLKGSIENQNGYFFIHESKNYRFPLGPHLLKALENQVGEPIQIGIRPEHVLLCEDEANHGVPDCVLKVIAYENMGNEQLVYFSLADKTLIIRRAPRETVDINKEKEIRFLRDKIIFINEKSGEVINTKGE
jgi:multiple sugar transport system ATP-binding protein